MMDLLDFAQIEKNTFKLNKSFFSLRSDRACVWNSEAYSKAETGYVDAANNW